MKKSKSFCNLDSIFYHFMNWYHNKHCIQIGIDALLNKGIYTSCYPLHDGDDEYLEESEGVHNDNDSLSQRKVFEKGVTVV